MALKEKSLKVLSEHADKLRADLKMLSNALGTTINQINKLQEDRENLQYQIDEINETLADIDSDTKDSGK